MNSLSATAAASAVVLIEPDTRPDVDGEPLPGTSHNHHQQPLGHADFDAIRRGGGRAGPPSSAQPPTKPFFIATK